MDKLKKIIIIFIVIILVLLIFMGLIMITLKDNTNKLNDNVSFMEEEKRYEQAVQEIIESRICGT